MQIEIVDDKSHWETVYATKRADAVSWFQPSARRSLELIQRIAPDRAAPIIDVGGGASVLVDELLRRGYRDLTVLDIAGNALDAARERLGDAGASVRWMTVDVRTAMLPTKHYAVWHDRAVFHFLADAADRAAYVAQLERAVRPGGFAIIATFAEDGPTTCSGLPVVRYSAESLHRVLGVAFELVASERESHVTPSGALQTFVYCVFRTTAKASGRATGTSRGGLS